MFVCLCVCVSYCWLAGTYVCRNNFGAITEATVLEATCVYVCLCARTRVRFVCAPLCELSIPYSVLLEWGTIAIADCVVVVFVPLPLSFLPAICLTLLTMPSSFGALLLVLIVSVCVCLLGWRFRRTDLMIRMTTTRMLPLVEVLEYEMSVFGV